MSHRTAAIALRWWPFAVVAAIWLVVATQQIGLPGVYMDAVNPDYLVVRLLNRHAQPITPWLMGGNYLFDRAPILISFYHGSQQVWLGLPFFALFGTTVTGLRLTHAMFALFILAALYVLLTRGGVKPWHAALAGVALAVDPAFSYAFRTQSYITLAPTAWLFLALYALQHASATSARRPALFVSGVFYGFAVVGYFIYAFYLPAMLLALALFSRHAPGRPRESWLRAWLPCWLGGLALGGVFYPIGYGLMIWDAGGLREAWSYFQQTQQALGVLSGQIPFADRPAHVANMVGTVFQNWFHHMLIFGEYAPLPGSTAKTWVLVAGPAALWLLAEARGRSSTLLRVLIAMPVSFIALALIFGTRLQGHHFVPLLPLAYAALASALSETVPGSPQRSRWMVGAAALVFAGLAALNVAGQLRESERLAQTRGVGLYSDAINRLGADLAAMNPKPFVHFPDWGLWMPVAFLTGGTVAMDTAADLPAARRMLCDGRDVAFAVIEGDRAARIETWRRELRWGEPARFAYRQGDGGIVFELATFKGQRDAAGCATP